MGRYAGRDRKPLWQRPIGRLCSMDFGYDARTLDLRKQLLTFMEERVYPAEAVFAEQVEAAAGQGRVWERAPVTADLKAEARGRGLWNLFLTGKAARAVAKLDATLLPDPPLTNLQYAPLAEITGWSPGLAPEALNCAAPTPATWNCWPSSARRNSRNAGSARCSR